MSYLSSEAYDVLKLCSIKLLTVVHVWMMQEEILPHSIST